MLMRLSASFMERFSNSDALIDHNENVGEVFAGVACDRIGDRRSFWECQRQTQNHVRWCPCWLLFVVQISVRPLRVSTFPREKEYVVNQPTAAQYRLFVCWALNDSGKRGTSQITLRSDRSPEGHTWRPFR